MTKTLGRPPLKGRPLTQAERHKRWKENLELRKKNLLDSTKYTKTRLNLALQSSVLDGVDIIAKSLGTSTTATIEILLQRASKQASEILDNIDEMKLDLTEDPELLLRVRHLIRAGYDIEDLNNVLNPED